MTQPTARYTAETFPPGEFIRQEIQAMGLTERGFQVLLFSVGCNDVQVFACELAAYADDKCLVLDADTAACLSKAIGGSPEYWMNIDKAWRATPATRPG